MRIEDMDRDQLDEYQEFLCDLNGDELDELNEMLERRASKDEILLWLHELADVFLEDDERE